VTFKYFVSENIPKLLVGKNVISRTTKETLMRRTKFRFLLIILLGVGLAVLLSTTGSAYVPPLTQASGATTPFTSGCNGAPQTGTNYPDAEVEPWVAVNPSNLKNIIGVWQQDRWSNGGANGLATGVSHDGGHTWSQRAAHFTRCSGGSASNGGDYERASDPWVTFSPNGTAHQIALVLNDSNPINGVTVSRSTDGGDNWSEPITLIRDTDPNFVDDKESITADPDNSNLVYAVWDRLDLRTEPDGNRGPALLAKTTNGGQSWNSPQTIYDPGYNGETIGNQIVVLPNGDLVDLFALFTGQPANTESPAAGPSYIAIVRSTDKGQTWSQQPIIISTLQSVGVTDPQTGEALRTGSIIPDIAVDQRTGYLYVVWQDDRFSGGKRDGIVFSKSTDGGFTWSAPVQVNRFPQVPAFTAAVDVANRWCDWVDLLRFAQRYGKPQNTAYRLLVCAFL